LEWGESDSTVARIDESIFVKQRMLWIFWPIPKINNQFLIAVSCELKYFEEQQQEAFTVVAIRH